jgi:hypothetical protein
MHFRLKGKDQVKFKRFDSMPASMSATPRRGVFTAVIVVLLAGLWLGSSLSGATHDPDPAAVGGEFFIVSSVNTEKKQLVLKRPTEVTVLVLVNEKTVYLDEQGKPLNFSELRAGDTVYVTATRSSEAGVLVATRIRKGPMTLEELRRRYLRRAPREE